MVILYGHPESGHTYKVALTLQLAGIPFEYRGISLPNLRHVVRFEEPDLRDFPSLCDWMQRLRALPRWRVPHDLLAKPAAAC